MNTQITAASRLTQVLYPAVKVADFATAEEAFLAAGCLTPVATVAAHEIAREPSRVACVALSKAEPDGDEPPRHAAWSLLSPEATEACVWASNGAYTLFAGYQAHTLTDEDAMEGLIRELERATGLTWVAIVQTRFVRLKGVMELQQGEVV